MLLLRIIVYDPGKSIQYVPIYFLLKLNAFSQSFVYTRPHQAPATTDHTVAHLLSAPIRLLSFHFYAKHTSDAWHLLGRHYIVPPASSCQMKTIQQYIALTAPNTHIHILLREWEQRIEITLLCFQYQLRNRMTAIKNRKE